LPAHTGVEVLPGEQPAILNRDLFDAVQAKLSDQRNNHTVTRAKSEALLIGRIRAMPARALGLALPDKLLTLADEVIE